MFNSDLSLFASETILLVPTFNFYFHEEASENQSSKQQWWLRMRQIMGDPKIEASVNLHKTPYSLQTNMSARRVEA